MVKNNESQPANVEIPQKVSIALKFLRFFQPQSIIGLILVVLFLQSNFYLSHFFNNFNLRAAIYLLNILFILFCFQFLPSSFIDFLFPTIPVTSTLKPTQITIKTELQTNNKNKNKNQKEIDLDSISVSIWNKNILEDQYFQGLLNYVDITRGAINIDSRILDNFTLLTISGWLSAFFAVLIIFRKFPLVFVIHFGILLLFIFSCSLGFRVIHSIRSKI